MGKLSTHVLDATHGKPAEGVAIELYALDCAGKKAELKRTKTNCDGRCDAPLLEGDELRPGRYELVFCVGDYFAAQGIALPEPRFLDRVTVAFGIADAQQNYHVPLVASPWAYSTYRGS